MASHKLFSWVPISWETVWFSSFSASARSAAILIEKRLNDLSVSSAGAMLASSTGVRFSHFISRSMTPSWYLSTLISHLLVLFISRRPFSRSTGVKLSLTVLGDSHLTCIIVFTALSRPADSSVELGPGCVPADRCEPRSTCANSRLRERARAAAFSEADVHSGPPRADLL